MTRVRHPWIPGVQGRTLVEDLRYWASEYCIAPALILAAADRITALEREMDQQKPSVGRVVHYVAYGTPGGEFPAGVCRCALVTEVDKISPVRPPSDAVGLCVLNPTGIFFNRGIPYDEGKAPGSWHWPERV